MQCGSTCARVGAISGPIESLAGLDSSEIANLPIDGMFCPTTCCGWGQDPTSIHTPWFPGYASTTIQTCDTSLDIQMYMGKGKIEEDSPNAATFAQQGTLCRRDIWANGSLLYFSCDMNSICDPNDLSFGLVSYNTTSGATEFLNGQAYPLSATRVEPVTGSKCKRPVLFWSYFAYCLGATIVLVILALWKRRRDLREEQQQQQQQTIQQPVPGQFLGI